MANKDRGLLQRLGLRRRHNRSPALGARELAVLDALWRHGRLSARQVLDAADDRAISLSTVQSTLERLHRKQVLIRHKEGRAYLYSARLTRENVISSLLQDITDEVAGGEISPVIAGFMAYLAGEDDEPTPLASSLPGDEDPDEHHD